MDIKLLLVESFNKVGFGFSFVVDKASLVELESCKRKNLLDRENEARQKSRATWLLCGDDNTPFFHKYANHRKHVNSIWKIVDDGGILVEGYESISEAGVTHFQKLFQEDNLHLPDIVQIVDYFPSSIIAKENDDLMCPVALSEI